MVIALSIAISDPADIFYYVRIGGNPVPIESSMISAAPSLWELSVAAQ